MSRSNPARMKRITKEVQQLAKKPMVGISFSVSEGNTRHLFATIDGPQDSPYEGFRFKLEVFLPNEYPMKPPKVRFMTPLYHPNVDSVGRICVDILKEQWSPALTITKILISLQALLSAPNPDDPLAPDIGRLWKRNITLAHKNARNHAREHGIPIPQKKRKADSQDDAASESGQSAAGGAAKKRVGDAAIVVSGSSTSGGSTGSSSSSSSSNGSNGSNSASGATDEVFVVDDIEDDFDDAAIDDDDIIDLC